MTLSRREALTRARRAGIRFHPARYAWRAVHDETVTEYAVIPYSVVCAVLAQESNGGENVWGHDVDSLGIPRPCWGLGEVTAFNYAVYLHERDLFTRSPQFAFLGRRMQGVGPMQLTWWTYQDEADREGGCWDPATNIRVGTRVLARERQDALKHRDDRWTTVFKAWNPNEGYAEEVEDRRVAFAKLLEGM